MSSRFGFTTDFTHGLTLTRPSSITRLELQIPVLEHVRNVGAETTSMIAVPDSLHGYGTACRLQTKIRNYIGPYSAGCLAGWLAGWLAGCWCLGLGRGEAGTGIFFCTTRSQMHQTDQRGVPSFNVDYRSTVGLQG